MAIASVTCTCARCGSTFEHRKTCYNRSEANDYEAWAAQNITICPTCWRAEQDAKRQAERQEASSAYNAPALTGSEKQVAWAEKIRAGFAVEAEKYVAAHSGKPEQVERFRAAVGQLLANHPDSRFWIDTRDEDFRVSGARRDEIRSLIAAQKAGN